MSACFLRLLLTGLFDNVSGPLAILKSLGGVRFHAWTDEHLHLSLKYHLPRDLVQRHVLRLQFRQGSVLLRPRVSRDRRTSGNRAPAIDARAMIRVGHRRQYQAVGLSTLTYQSEALGPQYILQESFVLQSNDPVPNCRGFLPRSAPHLRCRVVS